MSRPDDVEYLEYEPKYYKAIREGNLKDVKVYHSHTDGSPRRWNYYRGCSPLHWACSSKQDNRKVIGWLLDNGADLEELDSNGRTVVYSSLVHDRTGNAEYLIQRGANVTRKLKGKSIVTAALNDLKVLRLLVSNPKVDVNSKEEYGVNLLLTPLHKAQKLGLEDACSFLLSRDDLICHDPFACMKDKSIKCCRPGMTLERRWISDRYNKQLGEYKERLSAVLRMKHVGPEVLEYFERLVKVSDSN